jgi:hypothetical protein
MGGAKRYPSVSAGERDGFREELNPSYGLELNSQARLPRRSPSGEGGLCTRAAAQHGKKISKTTPCKVTGCRWRGGFDRFRKNILTRRANQWHYCILTQFAKPPMALLDSGPFGAIAGQNSRQLKLHRLTTANDRLSRCRTRLDTAGRKRATTRVAPCGNYGDSAFNSRSELNVWVIPVIPT